MVCHGVVWYDKVRHRRYCVIVLYRKSWYAMMLYGMLLFLFGIVKYVLVWCGVRFPNMFFQESSEREIGVDILARRQEKQ